MELDKLILEYENDFFRKTFCDNMQNLNNRIHDEFIEFGKSGQACRLLFLLAKKHKMKEIIITCSPENIASIKTCEYCGAELHL